jgi:hypothetical protein
MIKHVLSASLFAALALACGASGAAGPGPADVAETLRAAGYPDVRDLEFEDGLWEAEVRRPNGLWGEVAVDAATGEVFDAMSPRALVDAEVVIAALARAGYRDIHDLDREGALWDVDATDRDGRRVELRVSGYDARIVAVQHDAED